ncbi:hypothetical protein KQI42_20330 [Tissierella sp. MSJ-40]|uniref:Uncharacterized protein n=1 Tax=Tissierella simiarum TaxID=2841534 RepID=A0ABS6EBN1_9FIRM|nr:hypothetical protein [Tissierella simiarum]MBU5440347.1 hypothetical protein [Tissierella simiarum]
MKFKNKFLLRICLLFLAIIISYYGGSREEKNIYNDDGEIAQPWDNFSYRIRVDKEESNDKIDFKYSGFSGADTIWHLESEEDGEITFKYNSTVNRGDFKAVLINPKEEIDDILIGNEQDEKTIKLAKGKYIFKIVGRNAKGKTKISINKNQNVEITKIIGKF